MGSIASHIISLTTVYSIVYSDADQRKHQSSASLAFMLGIHRWPVNSPHKWPVTRKMFPFDDASCILKMRYFFNWNITWYESTALYTCARWQIGTKPLTDTDVDCGQGVTWLLYNLYVTIDTAIQQLKKRDQNGRPFADDIFKCIFWTTHLCILIQMSLKFVSNVPIELTHWGRDKWLPFSGRHFQMDFLEWKYIYFDWGFDGVCSHG